MADIPQPRSSVSKPVIPSQQTFDLNQRSRVNFTDQVSFRDVPLSVGEWILTIIVLAIPLANIVLYIYWAFISKGNQSRINFCRATIILAVFFFLVSALAGFSF